MTSRNIDDLICQYMLTIINQQDGIMQSLRNIQDINNNLSAIFLNYLSDRQADRQTRNIVQNETPTEINRSPLNSEIPPTRRNNFFPNIPFYNSIRRRTTTPVTPFSFGLNSRTNTTTGNATTGNATTGSAAAPTTNENITPLSTTSYSRTPITHNTRSNVGLNTIEEHNESGDQSVEGGRSSSTASRQNSNSVSELNNSTTGQPTRRNISSLRGYRNTILSAPGSNTVLGRRSRDERNVSTNNRNLAYNDVDNILRVPLETRRNRFHTRMRNRNISGTQTRRRQFPTVPTVNINQSFRDVAQNILNATMNDSPVRIIASRRQIAMATRIVQFRELESSDDNDNTTTDEDTICPIDRDVLAPEDYVMQIIHCGHYFREQNLRRHFRRNPRCPLCRFDIRDHGLGDGQSTNSSSDTENAQISQSTQTRPNYPPPPPPHPPSITNTPTTSNIIRDSINSTLGNLYDNISPLHDIENPFLTRPSSNINPTRQTTREINGNTITHTQSFTSGSDISGNNWVLST